MAKKNLSPEGKSESGARGMMPRVTSISNLRAGAGNAAREALYKKIAAAKAPKFNTTNPFNPSNTIIGKYTGEDVALAGMIGAGSAAAAITIANDKNKADKKRAQSIKKAKGKAMKGQSGGR